MRLSEWAKREGVSYITAWRWWNEGKFPVPARKVGKLILVDVPEPGQGRTVVYARVSSASQKPDLDGQIARVVAWCGRQHLPVDGTVTGSGQRLMGGGKSFSACSGTGGDQIGWSAGTGSPGSVPSTLKRRSPRPAGGSWWHTPPGPMMTWCGT